MLDELVAAFNKSESCPLLEFYHQNYLENELLKEENEQRSKKLLNEFLAKERNPKNKAVKVNFRRFKSHQISISEGVYGRGRITDTRQIADLIKKQKTANLARIANSMNLNEQDFNFIYKQAIDTEKLTEIVSRFGAARSHDWLEIAKIYGAKHTAIQLFKHYKTVINPNLKTTKFTKEEEMLLKRGIELYKGNSAAITTLLPGRDLNQIHAKRKYFMKKVGKWDSAEDELLVRAVELNKIVLPNMIQRSQSLIAVDDLNSSSAIFDDTNWPAVAEFMQTRNAEQCKNRYINKLNPTLDHSKLTNDENKKILDLFQELGVGKLKEITLRFPTRSPQIIANFCKGLSKKVKSSVKRKRKSD